MLLKLQTIVKRMLEDSKNKRKTKKIEENRRKQNCQKNRELYRYA